MADPKDTLLRQLVTLQLIPRAPGRIATTVLQEKLAERGFEVNLRSLQRDLKERLSLQFPLICDESEKPFRWSFAAGTQISMPSLDTPTALTLHLAEEHLRTLLPASVADLLNPQFDAARQHLQALSSNHLASWANSVRALPNGKTLIPAPIDGQIWQQVSEALLHKQQIRIQYLSRNQGEVRPFHLHPTGLVSRYSISYLIARVEGYDNLRHFALHRIRSVETLDDKAITPADFDIDRYIQQGAFSMSSGETTRLIADIHPQLAWILRETPLSHEQSIEPIAESDWFRLEAVVPMDQETLWWIMGLGERIRVREPGEWVGEITKIIENILVMYGRN
ncbi:MAG: WYL domain-containing protein [Gammaproteobacteria bacterium]|nr:WYL domain-containing protein [Gammaproteobacteria bacterium]